MLDRVRCLLVVPILVLLGGCLETEDLLVLNADGTGTFTATYVADTTKVVAVFDRVRELYPDNFRGSRLPKNMPQPFNRNWFELVAKAVKGVKITAGASVEKEGLRTSTIQATFDTLKSAVKGGLFFASAVKLRPVKVEPKKPAVVTGEKAPETETVAKSAKRQLWRLTLDESWIQTMGGPAPDEILPKFKDLGAGLKIVRRFRVPGRVVSTTGGISKDGRTVSFTYTLAALSKAKSLKIEIVFEEDEGATLQKFSTVNPDTRKGPLLLRFLIPPPKK